MRPVRRRRLVFVNDVMEVRRKRVLTVNANGDGYVPVSMWAVAVRGSESVSRAARRGAVRYAAAGPDVRGRALGDAARSPPAARLLLRQQGSRHYTPLRSVRQIAYYYYALTYIHNMTLYISSNGDN